MKKKKMFFGWDNIKWFIREFTNVYSSQNSFFSKKRIESSIAFFVGQTGMIWFLMLHVGTMNTYDMCMWAGVEFAIAGYIINQIQRQHRFEESNGNVKTEYENEYLPTCPSCGQYLPDENSHPHFDKDPHEYQSKERRACLTCGQIIGSSPFNPNSPDACPSCGQEVKF